jgi:hypothetical protein
VLVAAFRDSLSGDLLEIIGASNFIDILPMISEETRTRLEAHRADVLTRTRAAEASTSSYTGFKPGDKIDISRFKTRPMAKLVAKPAAFEPVVHRAVQTLLSGPARECLEHIMNFIDEKNYQRPAMVPLLRYLTDEMPLLANWERKDSREGNRHRRCGLGGLCGFGTSPHRRGSALALRARSERWCARSKRTTGLCRRRARGCC